MIAQIKTTHGKTFTMRMITRGMRYGLNNCLTHAKDEALVEFYDAAHAHSTDPDNGMILGQFVARYYLQTLLERPSVVGLCLDGGIPEWSLDAAAYSAAHALLVNWNQG